MKVFIMGDCRTRPKERKTNMGFSLDINIPAITVFLQGLVSFFSPCILPLLPLYIGYLSAGTKSVGEDEKTSCHRGRVMINTLFFVLGISSTFFLLGLGMTAFGRFFNNHQMLFARIGGIFVCFFGLYQLGVFGKSSVLERERRLPLRFHTMAMSPITAFLMGFTFSFAWTPCVGPALASVLIMVSSASTQTAGILLIGVYTLGFVLPFLAVGMFTTSLLAFFKKYHQVVKYTVKIGGVLMLVMGILMFTGTMNDVTGYLSEIPVEKNRESGGNQDNTPAAEPSEETASQAKNPNTEQPGRTDTPLSPAIDFTLTDQYGNTHTLSDYKGKTVFLNFWATWCPPCLAEMPDIQKIYESYLEKGDDSLVILGVAEPGQGRETTEEGVKDFLKENGYTYPVLMDKTGEQFMNYGISALPTTFMIDKNGNVFGYAGGQLSEEIMLRIIEQTAASVSPDSAPIDDASESSKNSSTSVDASSKSSKNSSTPADAVPDSAKNASAPADAASDSAKSSSASADVSESAKSPAKTSEPAPVAPYNDAPSFYYSGLTDSVIQRITGISYVENENVSLADLRYVHILHYNFEGNVTDGELICNASIAQDLLDIFYELYQEKYPIEKVRLIDEYGGDDTASITDNNTSCFNYRVVDGTTKLSKHAYGLAIDINPFYNPYVVPKSDGTTYISPKGSEIYADRSADFPHKIGEGDLCYRLFKEHGFTWGGNWKTLKDYQHFQKAK